MNRLTQKSQEALHDAQTKALRLRPHRGRRRAPAARPARPARRPRAPAARARPAPTPTPAGRRRGRAAPPAPGDRPRARAPGQVFVTQRLSRLLDAAEREANRLKDEYVSVEHLLLALADEGSATAAGRRLKEHGVTREAFLTALTRIRGNQRVTSAMPEVAYEALEKYGRDLVADARAGKLDPVIGRDAEIRRVDPDPVPQDQEQPGADRRPGCRQDRHRRGPGAADRPRRRARRAAGQDRSSPSTWARWSPEPSTAASSRSGSRPC